MAKKGTVTFGAAELQQIKSFYEQERIQLSAKLKHVDEVIARLGGATIAAADSASASAASVPRRRRLDVVPSRRQRSASPSRR